MIAELGIETVTRPYTGEQLLAAPAIRPQVTVLHAEAADREGNVLGPAQADFLFDMDANLARASERTIVTIERVAERSEIEQANRRTLLFGFEVDVIVVLARWRTPHRDARRYPPDVSALNRYLDVAGKDPSRAAAAMDELVRGMRLDVADRWSGNWPSSAATTTSS